MKVLELTSLDPFENGKQHGETFRTEIHELAEIRKSLVMKFFTNSNAQSEIQKNVDRQVTFLKTQPQYENLWKEFSGIAQAAHISESDLMILNNYTDLRDFGFQDEGCSAYAVSDGHRVWAGQTWDMHASSRPYALHLKIKNPIPCDVLTITGCLGLAGANRSRVAVLINNLHCKETHDGLLWPGLVRKMLETTSATSALKTLQCSLPCSGHNYLIVDRTQAINVETTGKRIEITGQFALADLKNGASYVKYLLHTNHYVGSLKECEIATRVSATTHARLESMKEYFGNLKASDLAQPDSFEKDLAHDVLGGNRVKNVCVQKPQDPHGPMTCGGLQVELVSGRGLAFGGLLSENDINILNLTG